MKVKILLLAALLFIVLHAVVGAQLEISHPNMEFLEPRDFDFGRTIQGEEVSHTFKFKNTGNADLEIYLVKASCLCTASLLSSKIIKPGAIGEFQLTFDSTDYKGRLSRKATIYSNDPKARKTMVSLIGYVEEENKDATFVVPVGYQLTVLYTGDERGQIEPCGCAEGQFGGFARQATLIDSERQNTSGGFLLLGVGDNFGQDEGYYRLRAEMAMQAMSNMRYDALVLGEREFVFGKPFVQAWMEKSRLIQMWIKGSESYIIAANIYDKSTGEPFASAPYIQESAGGIKVGIIGVMNGSYLPDARWQELGLSVSDPIEAVKKALEEIRPTSDLVIVLGHLDMGEATALAQNVDGIDLVITGHGDQKIAKPSKVGRTFIAMNNDRGQSIGKLEIYLNPEKKIIKIDGSTIPIADSVAQDPEIAELIAEYQTRLRELPMGSIKSIQEKYVTSESCRECHAEAYQAWKSSGHARAFETLEERDSHYDPECLKCHTTGYRLSTGFLRIDNTPQYKDVQCEACHGPGETHAADPTSAYSIAEVTSLCSSCHSHDRSPGFHYPDYWKVIQHE